MDIKCSCDLWEYLATSEKTVVLYGMGNGADKILDACAKKRIDVKAVFASDGFVSHKLFHGMEVCSWNEIKERFGAENVIVLLSFGSSRPEVLENIARIAAEAELYAPDVPAFGNGLFDRTFFEAHLSEINQAYALLSDDESRLIYKNVILFKLTGKIDYLFDAESDPQTVIQTLVRPEALRAAADLGAYNGDTVRQLLDSGTATLQTVYALEPDPRNFRKLAEYAASETRAAVHPFEVGAWSEQTTLIFDDSGNRNASFEQNRSQTLDARPHKQKSIKADTLDHILDGARVDYIKYDVEGSEKEALLGSIQTVRACSPTLLVSLYHRTEDIFALPLLIRELFPQYQKYYLRRFRGVPAWDLNLYLLK